MNLFLMSDNEKVHIACKPYSCVQLKDYTVCTYLYLNMGTMKNRGD